MAKAPQQTLNPNYIKIGRKDYKAKCPKCGSKKTDFHLSRSAYSVHKFMCGKCGYLLEW